MKPSSMKKCQQRRPVHQTTELAERAFGECDVTLNLNLALQNRVEAGNHLPADWNGEPDPSEGLWRGDG